MVLGVASHGVRCCCHGAMVGALVVSVGTVVVVGEVVSVAPTVVVVIENLDVIRALLAATAAAVAAVPTVSPTIAVDRCLLPDPIVVVIIDPLIVPPIVLRQIVNLLLHN